MMYSNVAAKKVQHLLRTFLYNLETAKNLSFSVTVISSGPLELGI